MDAVGWQYVRFQGIYSRSRADSGRVVGGPFLGPAGGGGQLGAGLVDFMGVGGAGIVAGGVDGVARGVDRIVE